IRRGRPLVGGLHESGTAARDDVTAHLGQGGRHALDLVVDESPRLGPRRAEDRHAVTLVLGWTQPGEVVDDIPETENGADEDLLDRFLVREADGSWLFLGCILRAHCPYLTFLE